ncbi:class I adenylate-forming enzyme family protein [Rhodococcus sp. NPDC127530]|uniref:class I adenylate-forming enzyme family protein n=1 Tax=unclassified Rhodococcus (in: high G+C Gram-positive bacteria) TaxID=192944 RepID=UPI00363C244A
MSSSLHLPQHLDYPPIGFDSILDFAARAYRDRTALRDGELTLSFAELHDHALRLAGGLRAQGVRPGDLVALHMPNSLWFPVAYFGVLCAGATACPVNPAQPGDAMRHQLEHFGATAMITHASCAGVVAAHRPPGLRLVTAVPPTEAAPDPEAGERAEVTVSWSELLSAAPLHGAPVDAGSVAHLQLTGGTTGRSKGVRVLHCNLVSNVLQIALRRSGVVPGRDANGDIILKPLPYAQTDHTEVPGRGTFAQVAPYFHGLGLVGQCANTLLGLTTVIVGRFDPERYLADIERYGVTKLGGSAAFYHALLESPAITERDLSSVLSISCGGAPIDTGTLDRLRAAFPSAEVIQVYGLSEATCTVTMQPPAALSASPAGSAGVPVPDTEVELRDESGIPVSRTGDVGEICVRGPQVTDSYHRDAVLTGEQFTDGWLRTGDLGRFDEKGNLFIVGRAKDMIIYKGYNVYPAHLEEVLGRHPAVARSAVVGVPRTGVDEIPVAFVVAHPNRRSDTGLASELIRHVDDRVAPYQRVRELHFVDDLPLSPTGKVLKSALRNVLTGPGGSDTPTTGASVSRGS